MNTTDSPRLVANVVIKPAAPKIQEDIFLVATIECPQMGVPEAHLLFAPKDNSLALVAPCGCQIQVRITRLILDLAETLRRADHSSGGSVH